MSYTASRVVPTSVSAGMFSVSAHVLVLLLLLAAAAVVVPPPQPQPPHDTTLHLNLLPPVPVPAPPTLDRQESGGGPADIRPVRKGPLPEAKPARVFIPPMLAVNDHPQLPVEIGIANLPDLDVDGDQFGDPFGLNEAGGLGRGRLDGIGDGDGPGVGPGNGGGFSRVALVEPAKITRGPQLIYKVEPEYSEEARRARIQGSVRLRVEVGLDGRPSHIQVVQSIGLGLDENAIEAIKHWLFRPALAGDRPVAAPAMIEVSFHLI